MVGKLVGYQIEAGVAVVTIDNPPVNALTRDMATELVQVFTELGKLAHGKNLPLVVVLAAVGNKIFVSGADINLFLALGDRAVGESLSAFYQDAFDEIEDFAWPVICAVEGLALGGGTELALACDIRVAGENARFGLTEVKLGIIPGGGGTQRLPRLVGPGKAKEMIFTGRIIGAQEALQVGLVESLVPAGESLAQAVAIARQILANAPLAVKLGKEAVNRGLSLTLRKGMSLEKGIVGELAQTEDLREGAKAFLEKRPPAYRGK